MVQRTEHLDIFWKLWFNEYALSLRERTQKTLKTPRIQSAVHPSKGDVVLLKDNSLRGSWRLGKIEALITSQEKEVRAATGRTSSGKLLNRALNFLYPLECSELSEDKTNPDETNDHKESKDDSHNQENRQRTANERPIRQAAIETRKTLHNYRTNRHLYSCNFSLSYGTFFCILEQCKSRH